MGVTTWAFITLYYVCLYKISNKSLRLCTKFEFSLMSLAYAEFVGSMVKPSYEGRAPKGRFVLSFREIKTF